MEDKYDEEIYKMINKIIYKQNIILLKKFIIYNFIIIILIYIKNYILWLQQIIKLKKIYFTVIAIDYSIVLKGS